MVREEGGGRLGSGFLSTLAKKLVIRLIGMKAAEEQLIRIDHTSSLRAMINPSFHKYDRKHICQRPVIDPESSSGPESASASSAFIRQDGRQR